jgi:CheY-like chemotaxis protein
LGPLIKETFKLLRASIPSTIELTTHFKTDADTVWGDPNQIQQVILNLAANSAYALKGMKGTIDISLRSVRVEPDGLPEAGMRPGDYLVLSVADTGVGMDADVKRRIFEPFFTTKPIGEGTGLGLSVVHGIIKGHAGAVLVKSAPGGGAEFSVYLPRAEAAVPAAPAETLKIPGGNERILLVDDEEIIVHSVREMLERLGYRVSALAKSPEALKLFSEDPSRFDLVMTDQTMPSLTGEELGKAIKSIRPDIPIILCTGYGDLISHEEAWASGFQGFLTKPYSIREAAVALRSALDKKTPGTPGPSGA